MKKDFFISFLIPFILGSLIWFFSPEIGGKIEPIGAGNLYYLKSLILLGVMTSILRAKHLLLVYLAIVSSQIIYLYYFLPYPPSKFVGVSVGFIFFFATIPIGISIVLSFFRLKVFGKLFK